MSEEPGDAPEKPGGGVAWGWLGAGGAAVAIAAILFALVAFWTGGPREAPDGLGFGRGAEWTPEKTEAALTRVASGEEVRRLEQLKAIYPEEHAVFLTRLAAEARLSRDVGAFRGAAERLFGDVIAEKSRFLPYAPLEDLRAHFAGLADAARLARDRLGDPGCAAIARVGPRAIAQTAASEIDRTAVGARFDAVVLAAISVYRRGEDASSTRRVASPSEEHWAQLIARLRADGATADQVGALISAEGAADADLCGVYLLLLDALATIQGPKAETMLPFFANRLAATPARP